MRFLLLIYTGSRRGEVLGMRWSDLDLDGDAPKWKRRAADQKGGRDHWLPLARPAVAVLRTIRDAQLRGKQVLPEHVFDSASAKGRHLVEIKRTWRNVIKAAALPGVRIHDLRHTAASLMASKGQSLVVIGEVLGHKSAQTTARYSHLLDQVVKVDAVEEIGAEIEEGGPGGPRSRNNSRRGEGLRASWSSS